MRKHKKRLPKKSKQITIRISEEELEEVKRKRLQTLSPSLAHYARTILLNQPVTRYIRIQSVDDLLPEVAKIQQHLADLLETQVSHKPGDLEQSSEANLLASLESLLNELNKHILKILNLCLHISTK